MGLKLAISGKGGVGKSTVSAMFAHLAVADGWRVLAIDADPDANLAAALGMPLQQRRAIVALADRRALVEERTGAKVKQYGQVFKLNPDVADIAEQETRVRQLESQLREERRQLRQSRRSQIKARMENLTEDERAALRERRKMLGQARHRPRQ